MPQHQKTYWGRYEKVDNGLKRFKQRFVVSSRSQNPKPAKRKGKGQ